MVFLTEDGFYQVKEKPTPEELNEYYSRKYYQDDKSTYGKTYSEEEIRYLDNKDELKYMLLADNIGDIPRPRLLDIGCGEGFTLSHFHKKGWDVKGLDFSEFGLNTHNPHMRPHMDAGDVYDNIGKLKKNNVVFDVLWIDNVLEHVLDPFQLLEDCRALTTDKGMLVVEVPNDFSPAQMELKDKGIIKEDFWVLIPDHISYFNRSGLVNIAKRAGWDEQICVSDFPIDFNLFNPEADYINNRAKGKGAHRQRVSIENLLHKISPSKTVALYKAMADLGLGRQIIAIFKKDGR